jgi:hypothetical protein
MTEYEAAARHLRRLPLPQGVLAERKAARCTKLLDGCLIEDVQRWLDTDEGRRKTLAATGLHRNGALGSRKNGTIWRARSDAGDGEYRSRSGRTAAAMDMKKLVKGPFGP